MRMSIITASLAMLGFGSMAGCDIDSDMIEGTTVEEKFWFVAGNNSDFAHGLAYAGIDQRPSVLVAGPSKKGGDLFVNNDARWHIGSISKSFTASLIMRFVERGALDLDAPIGGYLGRYSARMHSQWRAITLRQLLSHTAGLPANAPARVMLTSASYEPVEGRRTVLSGMWQKPLPGQVGRHEYSNVGYVLAGVVAEEITGTPWEELIKSEIADPMGLTSLGFGAPTGVADPRGHSSNFGRSIPIEPNDLLSDNPAWMGPAGTIHMSISDLARWGQIHLRACRGQMPQFLSQESCQMMQTAVADDYGFGWVINAPNVVWHNGSNTLWYAVLHLDTAKGTSVAVVTNTAADGRIDALTQAIAETLSD